MVKHHLILVGFMGSGKSTLAPIIAKKMKAPHFDTDQIFVQNTQMEISAFFKKYGESAFRSLEQEILYELLKSPTSVIATGGGMMINPLNRKRMYQAGFIVHLRVHWPIIRARLEKQILQRPMLKGTPMQQEALFWKRLSYYAKADYVIDASKSPKFVASCIISWWRLQRWLSNIPNP